MTFQFLLANVVYQGHAGGLPRTVVRVGALIAAADGVEVARAHLRPLAALAAGCTGRIRAEGRTAAELV